MKIFAIVAKPVLHSLSPTLHNYAFQKLGIAATYSRLIADSAKEACDLMHEIGILGINVSAPFKEEFIKYIDNVEPSAQTIGAVNTVILETDGTFSGYNTDVDGVIGALCSHDVNVQGHTVLVLGAGGAARAAVAALQSLGATPIIAARRAEAFDYFKQLGIKCVLFDELSNIAAEPHVVGVVSTLPSSAEILETLVLRPEQFLLDANYKDENSLRKIVEKSGAKYIAGIYWLLHQAVRAFELFTGKAISVEIFQEALRSESLKSSPLFLTGLMGTGKSTVGKLIGSSLGIDFVDLDSEIEKKRGAPITKIFAENGEAFFRESEQQIFFDILKQSTSDAVKKSVCLSCGGGVVLQKEIRQKLKNEGLNIWLWTNPEVLANRIQDTSDRPLLRGQDRLTVLTELLAARKAFYAEASSLIISSQNRSFDEIAQRITYEYCSTFKS